VACGDKLELSKRRKHIHDKKKTDAVTKTILVLFTTRTNCPLSTFTNLEHRLLFPLWRFDPVPGSVLPVRGFAITQWAHHTR